MMISFSKSVPMVPQRSKRSSIEAPGQYYSNFSSDARPRKGAIKITPTQLSFAQMRLLYLVNAWVRVCVDKITNRAAAFPFIVRPVNVNTMNDETRRHMDIINEWLLRPNDNKESKEVIRKKLHHDILVLDAGVIEKAQNVKITVNNKRTETMSDLQLYCIPGDTVRPNPDSRGIYPTDDSAYYQYGFDSKIVHSWSADQIIYHIENPRSNQIYGTSRLETLCNTIKSELDAAMYNSDFFINNATPRFAVLFNDVGMGAGNTSVLRFRQWWEQELRGKPHKPIVIAAEKGQVSFQKISLSAAEMEFEKYQRWLMMKIFSVYGLTPVIAGVADASVSKANAEKDEQLFKQDALRPALRTVADKWNVDLVFDKTGFGFDDVFLDHDLDLVDSDRRARYQEKYLRSGVLTINDVRRSLGLPDVYWGDIPALQNNLQVLDENGNSLFDDSGEADADGVDDSEDDSTKASPVRKKNVDYSRIFNYYKNRIKTPELHNVPIGWEHLDPTARVAHVEKILKNRVAALQKAYSFAKNPVGGRDANV